MRSPVRIWVAAPENPRSYDRGLWFFWRLVKFRCNRKRAIYHLITFFFIVCFFGNSFEFLFLRSFSIAVSSLRRMIYDSRSENDNFHSKLNCAKLLPDSNSGFVASQRSPVRMLTAKRVELARKRQGEASSQSEYLGNSSRDKCRYHSY